MTEYDVIVIGGGPAGLAAAVTARQNGAQRVAVIERDHELGGILNQCIHNGFGLHHFKEELTGPEYAGRFVRQLHDIGADMYLDTMVLAVMPDKTVYASGIEGYLTLHGKAVVLAMGCRERSRGAVAIPGDRPAGVFTAGTAQRYVNMEGYMVGRRVLILGSGDIGLIMARRMTLEGAKVLACVEIMPYSGGLSRNIAQCLDDFGIPLYLSHTITDIRGSRRVEQAVVAQVDDHRRPIAGTEQVFDCDTVLLSVGLIPENELTRACGIDIDPHTRGAAVYENRETSVSGIFACGNVLQVHDLVDFVTAESVTAGAAAAAYAVSGQSSLPSLSVTAGEGVSYVVPQKIRPDHVEKLAELFFRVRLVYRDAVIRVRAGEEIIASFRREHMAPGEMEKIVLPRVLLDKAAGRDLTVSVEVPA